MGVNMTFPRPRSAKTQVAARVFAVRLTHNFANLSDFLPDGIIAEEALPRTLGKALALWCHAHGFVSERATEAAFKAHPEWRGA